MMITNYHQPFFCRISFSLFHSPELNELARPQVAFFDSIPTMMMLYDIRFPPIEHTII